MLCYIINKPVKLCCPGAVGQVAIHLPRQLIPVLQDSLIQRFSMELDLQSLFGLHVTWCAQLYSVAETPQLPPPPAFGLALRGRYWSANDRRHLFVTHCLNLTEFFIMWYGDTEILNI